MRLTLTAINLLIATASARRFCNSLFACDHLIGLAILC